MMVDEARRFDQYDQIVPAAAAVTESEWESAAQVAVARDMVDVLKHLRLERHSAGLARMGVSTLLDVGEQSPNTMIEVAGLRPREYLLLLTELLGAHGWRDPWVEPAPRESIRGRGNHATWESPRALGVKAMSEHHETQELCDQARQNKLTEAWLTEQADLKQQISDLQARSTRDASAEVALEQRKSRMRTKVLREELAALEMRSDEWEIEQQCGRKSACD